MLRHPAVRLAWCVFGAATAVGLALWAMAPPRSPFLLVSVGGSTIFLFGMTRAPAAQPRALFGGHLGGAVIGIACYQVFGDGMAVAALAMALTLAYMLVTRTAHPPAGATPLVMIHAHAGWGALLQPLIVGIGSLFVVAALWSRLYPGLARYPRSLMEPSPPAMDGDGWVD